MEIEDEERLKNLRRVREVNWAEIEALEIKLLREKTLEQGIRDYLALRSEFEPLLRQTEPIFGQDHIARLIRLQERFQKLQEWRNYRMEEIVEALVKLQALLNNAGIPSATIGGLAIGAWGKARVTRDADLKILLRRSQRKRLLDLIAPHYRSIHADPDAALRNNGIVFVLYGDHVRLDLMLADTEYDELLISRARTVELTPDKFVRVCTAEDLVILKIVASRPQDTVDVENIVQRQGDKLDEIYILEWLGKFEKAIDDSTLIREYRRIRERYLRE